jgi:DNA-binding MarR family transcriptional regulator
MTRSLQQVGLSVKRLQADHHRAIDARLAGIGVSLVQWDALRHLAANPGASLHDLARLTFQSDQAFGTLAGRMIDRGFIERVPGPGRAVRHRITGKGKDILEQASPLVDQVLAGTLGTLAPAELEVLGDLLERLVSAARSS